MNKTNMQDSFNHLMGLAQRSHQKGDLNMAINLYKESLKVIPKQVDALHYLGIAYCSQQNFEQGITYLEKASTQAPTNPVILTNLSNAYLKTEDYTKALPLLQKSVELKPDFDEAWHKLANTYKALNNIEQALESYTKTITLNPNHYNAYYNLGNTMMLLGNYKTAINHYEKSLSLNPNFAPAHNNLGIALLEWERIEEAEQHYLKATQIQTDYTEAIKNLVQLYSKTGNESSFEHWSKELLRINPDNVYLRFELETKAPAIPESNQDIDTYRNWITSYIEKQNPYAFSSIQKLVEHACYPSSELIYQGRPNKEIKEKYAKLFQYIPKAIVNHHNTKPHIGFVVTHGHEGVFLKCMRGIVNTIDTNKMDVSIVCSLPNGQKIIEPMLTNKAIRFINLPNNFITAQKLVIDSKFDLLHYWEIGTDATNYFLALTKPAKIQVTSWGWPITSGLETVDYFISHKNLEPENGQEHYTEKLLLLEKLPVFYYPPPIPKMPKPLSYYGLGEKGKLYLCQQNLRKVHPDFDSIIASILTKDAEGIILFIKDKQKAITEKLQKRMAKSIGQNFNRVIFIDRMSEEDYLGLLMQSTVVLDTVHYGGGANTVYDAFQASVPIVTLEGSKHSGRFASAALTQIGVTETIANSIEDYVEKAVTIVNNNSIRKTIVDKLKENSKRIFEDIEAVKELEQALLKLAEKITN